MRMYKQFSHVLHLKNNNIECEWKLKDYDFENESFDPSIYYKYF